MIKNLKERERKILDLLYENDNTSIATLCEMFDVTTVTIRKDLDNLEDKGLIARTHGGALPLYNRDFMGRSKENADAKMRIAKMAAEMINDGDRITIISGTTASLIPKFLYGKRNVHIVTNSTMLLTYSRTNPNIKVTLVGGEFLSDAEALVGSITLRELDMFHTSKAFIGCDGFSLEGGITANHTELAEVCRKIITRCDEVYLLADASKYNKIGFSYIDRTDNINKLITDTSFSAQQQKTLEKMKIELINV